MVWHKQSALLTGMMATIAGIGLSRFAYTPLIPVLIEQHWFGASDAAYIGAANLLGYLIGALSAHPLTERFSYRWVLSIAFVVVALSFLLCAGPFGFAWFFIWRLLSGVAGAILVVAGPSMALAATPAEQRTTMSIKVFTGIGVGAMLSATVIPALLEVSLTATWIALGVVSLLVGVIGIGGLLTLGSAHHHNEANPGAQVEDGGQANIGVYPALVVWLVIAAYGLDAAGFVPHTLFWVDYLAREQALGQHAGSVQWGLFGLGAVLGPLLAGFFANRIGCHRGLMLAYSAKALAVAIPLISVTLVFRSLSSFIFGAMVPCLVALTSGRLAELVGPVQHKRVWGQATAAFAAAQAVAGYGMSALYDLWGTHYPLFAIGSSLLLCCAALIWLSQRVLLTNHALPQVR